MKKKVPSRQCHSTIHTQPLHQKQHFFLGWPQISITGLVLSAPSPQYKVSGRCCSFPRPAVPTPLGAYHLVRSHPPTTRYTGLPTQIIRFSL